MISLENPTKIYKMTPILPDPWQKIEKEGILSNSFYETSITIIPKPNKTNMRGKDDGSRMNIDAKTLNKILANQI